jgi:hypothetical protein
LAIKPDIASWMVLWMLLFLAPRVHAQTAAVELSRAVSQHDALEFEKCLASLDRAARHTRSSPELARIELYRGLCQAGIDNFSSALEHFKLGLSLDSTLRLPSFTSPKVTELFETAHRQVTPPPPVLTPSSRAEEALLPQASAATVAQAPLSKTWALVPTGIAALAGGLALLWGMQAKAAEGDANRAAFADEAARLGDVARGHSTRTNVALGIGVAAVVGTAIVLWVARTPSPEAAK